MRRLDAVAAIPYRDPWTVVLADRLRRLAGGRRRVAYFYEQADNSTFRYRVYNMAQVLNDGSGDVSAAYFFHEDLAELDLISELADRLVICRTRWDDRVGRLIAAFRRLGKPVLYDIDDYVFDTRLVPTLVDTLDLDPADPRVWDDWFAYTSRLGTTLRQCDRAIATTPTLARAMADFAGIPVSVAPNFLNVEQLEVSDRLFAATMQAPLGEDGLVHLGYFSGSPSHNKDFAIIAPALEALLEQDESLGVVVVGYIEPGPGLTRFGRRVRRFPFQDYVNLQRLIAAVEYNLMPLQHNVFTSAKSELKYFDAAVVGSVSIASPTTTHASVIRHGENGYLAQAHQWQRVIREALDDRPRYRELAQRAHDHARAVFGHEHQRETILRALGLSG
ncbi:MAG: glycosyltransferase [Rubrivivax sp.]|nr:glycosyltransferase [Rubrivivax sp.]